MDESCIQPNGSNVIVNMVNIADVVDSSNINLATSCIVLVGIEPFAFKDFTIETLKSNIKITKDINNNIYINNKKANFVDVDNGIKVLIILSEEAD